ncbi:plancitoxin-1-like [Dicentrarchus labrax]|nr:plancitoxin-1-like [Dicentrarchus labrax]
MEVMWKLVLAVVLAVALLCGGSDGQIGCRNEADQPVDWYILYKLPAHTGIGDVYYYIDTKVQKMNTEMKPVKPINHQAGVLANTLAPYFNKEAGSGYIAYSDQPPTSNALPEFGHSKGFVMMDQNSGFWLLHSTPRFPFDKASNNFFPESGKENGQTFICVTFPYATFKQIGLHLQYIHAHTFEHNIPDGFHNELKKAAKLKDGTKLKEPADIPKELYQDLKSNANHPFRSFVKKVLDTESDDEDCDDEKKRDLYFHIAQNIGSSVRAQTWNQGNKFESEDPVYNVECIEVGGKKWNTNDHSKWCVSVDDKGPEYWTCFGDSNRARSQCKRRGGALCIQDKTVNGIFKNFIKPKADCKKQSDQPSAPKKLRQ